jgi:cell division protein FtsW (lipid II flippase)
MNKTMSLLSIWLASQEEKNKGTRMIIQVIFGVLLALAVFLAVKDMGLLSHTSTKVWVLLLAVVMPELYIILHGVSTSSMGVNFFTGSPVESKMGSDWFKPKTKSWGHGAKAAAMDMDTSSSLGSDMGYGSGSASMPKASNMAMATPTATDTSSSLF